MSNPRIPYRMSSERPRIAPPDGKPLIVHLVVNVEHWRFDQGMPRILEMLAHRGRLRRMKLTVGFSPTDPNLFAP